MVDFAHFLQPTLTFEISYCLLEQSFQLIICRHTDMMDSGNAVITSAKAFFAAKLADLHEIEWEHLPEDIKDYLKANPGQSLF